MLPVGIWVWRVCHEALVEHKQKCFGARNGSPGGRKSIKLQRHHRLHIHSNAKMVTGVRIYREIVKNHSPPTWFSELLDKKAGVVKLSNETERKMSSERQNANPTERGQVVIFFYLENTDFAVKYTQCLASKTTPLVNPWSIIRLQ